MQVTYIHIAWYLDQRPVSRMSLLPAQFRDVSEEYWRGEVSLDVSLFEWLNFAGKDMLERKSHVVLRLNGFGDHVES